MDAYVIAGMVAGVTLFCIGMAAGAVLMGGIKSTVRDREFFADVIRKTVPGLGIEFSDRGREAYVTTVTAAVRDALRAERAEILADAKPLLAGVAPKRAKAGKGKR